MPSSLEMAQILIELTMADVDHSLRTTSKGIANMSPKRATIAHLRHSMHLVCEFSEVCLGYMQFQVLKRE